MGYKINFEEFKSAFSLPQAVIDEDISKVDGDCLKVVLFIFKNSERDYSVNLLSNLLNIPESKVEEAIEYWISKGILKSDNQTAKLPPVIISSKTAQPKIKVSNSELTYMLECAENCLKRPISSVEYKTIVHIWEYLKLPADVIIMAIEYCVSIDKANVRYIERVCTTWADNSITTHELAEQYLSTLKKAGEYEGKIKKLLSIDRALIESERECIYKWASEYKFSLEMVKLAYEKTITAINKLSFPYMNKILISWREKGYKTVDEVKSGKLSKASANPSYDIEEIDKYWDEVPKLV